LTKTPAAVSGEEAGRRLAEYRRLGLERRAPAHVVYNHEHVDCPWAGCGSRIAGINFRLESQGDAAKQEQWLTAWWAGPGLVARCPGCGRYVLFSLDGKRAVADPTQWTNTVLPDAWHTKAHVVEGSV
jgi:hypothetical protein